MKKAQITNYIREDNKEIISFIKETEITNNNEANKFKNILTELKDIEKEFLIPIIKNKKEKYAEYKIVLEKEKEIKEKADFIKSLISNKLTEWNNSKVITTEKGGILETKIITNSYVKKYKELVIEIEDIDKVPDEFITKYLNFSQVKKVYKDKKEQIKGLKIYEREVIK